MKILVIQLARLGDILQTLPTLAGIKNKHPNATIDLVVRESFAEAALLSPHADRVISLPSRAIFTPIIDDLKNLTNEQKAVSLAHLITWLADQFLEKTHATGPYDLTLNLTFSESSSYLAQLIPSKEIRGLKRATDGAYAVTDLWGAYIYAQVLRKNMNEIHLNDLFARMANVVAAPVEPVVRGFDSSYDLGNLVVGLQMGASQSNKTLNPKIWGSLANSILEALPDAHLILFGGRDDKKRAKAVLDATAKHGDKRLTNLVGRLKFHHNVPWVKRCDFMITPDTAMVHLAPLCGIKTINISVGDVNPIETGPYGEGHWVLRPRDGEFADGIQPLTEAVIGLIHEDDPGTQIPAAKTKLITCSDGTLRTQIVPINYTDNEVDQLFRTCYYLLAEFRNSGRLEDLPIPVIGSADQQTALDDLRISIQALETTRKLAEFGQAYCLKMLEHPTNKAILDELGSKIAEIESLYRNLHAAVPYIRPLLDSWEVAKENVIGDGIEDLASLTEGTFREMIQNIDMIHQLIQLALDNAEQRMNSDSSKNAIEPQQKEMDNEDYPH